MPAASASCPLPHRPAVKLEHARPFWRVHKRIARSLTPDMRDDDAYGHIGMTGAPMTARVLAELISGEALALDLMPFSPRHFM